MTITSEGLHDYINKERGISVMMDIRGVAKTARLTIKDHLHRFAYLLNKYVKSKYFNNDIFLMDKPILSKLDE